MNIDRRLSNYNYGFTAEDGTFDLTPDFILSNIISRGIFGFENFNYFYFKTDYKSPLGSSIDLTDDFNSLFDYYNNNNFNINRYGYGRRGLYSVEGLEYLKNPIMKKDFIPLVYDPFKFSDFEHFKDFQKSHIFNNIDYEFYSFLPFVHLYFFINGIFSKYYFSNAKAFVKCTDGFYYNSKFERYNSQKIEHILPFFIDSPYAFNVEWNKGNSYKFRFSLSFDISKNTYFHKAYTMISSYRVNGTDDKISSRGEYDYSYANWTKIPDKFLFDPFYTKSQNNGTFSKNTTVLLPSDSSLFISKQDFGVDYMNVSGFVENNNLNSLFETTHPDNIVDKVYEFCINNNKNGRGPQFYEVIPAEVSSDNPNYIKSFHLKIYRYIYHSYLIDDGSSDIIEPSSTKYDKNSPCCFDECSKLN